MKIQPKRASGMLASLAAALLAPAAAGVAPAAAQEYPTQAIRILEVHRMRMSNGVGEHLMHTWPTSY